LQTALWSSQIKEDICIPVRTIISCLIAALNLNISVRFYDGQIADENLMRCHLFGHWNDSMGTNIIDDCSQYWKPFPVTKAACFSLYANKLITSGEGGMIVTNDPEIYHRAKSYRNLCHTEERFVHDQLGQNFRMSNLQAALGLAQLEQINNFIEIKQRNRDLYKRYLSGSAQVLFDVEIPWMYLISTTRNAKEVINKLFLRGIECRRYFYPLHHQPCLKQFPQYKVLKDFFPHADWLWNHAFYLPSGLTLTQEEVKKICRCLEITLNTMM
jgi:dTDP-4-amino-4,6-dideoxygalactose transaminase